MAKRKRVGIVDTTSKKPKTNDDAEENSTSSADRPLSHPVLSQYYPKLLTLRQYLADQLPATSKRRRRRILHYGKHSDTQEISISGSDSSDVVNLLDKTIIGVVQNTNEEGLLRKQELQVFTQQLSNSSAGMELTAAKFMQAEVE